MLMTYVYFWHFKNVFTDDSITLCMALSYGKNKMLMFNHVKLFIVMNLDTILVNHDMIMIISLDKLEFPSSIWICSTTNINISERKSYNN